MNRPLSLMEIDGEIAHLLATIEEGEVSDEIDAAYQSLLEMAADKCDAYVWRITEMKQQVKAGKELVAEMAARVNRLEKTMDSMKERLAVFMGNRGIKRLDPQNKALPKVLLMKGKDRLVFDEDAIPELYKSVVMVVDKDMVKRSWEAGTPVPGVTSVKGDDYLVMR